MNGPGPHHRLEREIQMVQDVHSLTSQVAILTQGQHFQARQHHRMPDQS